MDCCEKQITSCCLKRSSRFRQCPALWWLSAPPIGWLLPLFLLSGTHLSAEKYLALGSILIALYLDIINQFISFDSVKNTIITGTDGWQAGNLLPFENLILL